MKLEPYFNYLMVPGLNGSGADHWQTYWEMAYPEILRVEQKDWDKPDCSLWVDKLENTILHASDKPVILIGHSLGCATILHASKQGKLRNVVGAFLVAMPNVERLDFPNACVGFTPMPREKLPFVSIVIASENDPYITAAELKKWAGITGSEFISVGNREHIGSLAKLGYWEEGQELFRRFVAIRLKPNA